MGLYDELIVAYALEASPPENVWQSKDLSDKPCADMYRLDEQGHLWRFYSEQQPEKTDPLMWKVPRSAIVVPNVDYSSEWERSDLSRKVRFYAYVEHRHARLFWEYEAVFEQGTLQSLTRIRPRNIPE